MKIQTLIFLLVILVTISGCSQIQEKIKQPIIKTDNQTLIFNNTIIGFEVEKNHTAIVEYSSDKISWKQVNRNQFSTNSSLLFNIENINDGEYFLRLTDFESNLSNTKKIIISRPPKFDLKYKLELENKTLSLSFFPENLSGEVRQFNWDLDGKRIESENITISYTGQNITTTLTATNSYNLTVKKEMSLNNSILENTQYCIVKDLEIKNSGETEYEYKSVVFDLYNIRVNVGPQRSKPILGKVIKSESDKVVLGYGLELIGSFYGDISRCESGQLVKGTRIFYQDGEYTEWFDTNYPSRPGPKGPCPYNSTVFCNDDYSINAKQKSPVLESGNKTIYWYDIPNIMLPVNFFPVTINQTFVSYIGGDNGYCWIKWNLYGEYEKDLKEKNPLTAVIDSAKCFDPELPVKYNTVK
ncbi:MAG: hypothetical protein HY512_04345 [Candidatus Aenigmarchaeota archaeon]|nr:hypothetical protein [Candidatus Aenigmarchaeota archaeon]